MIAPTAGPGDAGRRDADHGRPLALDDAARFAALTGVPRFVPSEYRFANLWLFRARHRYRLVEDPLPHVRGVAYDGAVHALPLTPPGEVELRALATAGVDCLYPLGQDMAEVLAHRFGLPLSHDPADSDYWYDGPAMAALTAARVRRGQARRFAERADPIWTDWSATSADEARRVLEGWAADVGRSPDRTDISECREAIELAMALGLEGGIVRSAADGPVAFLLASRADEARVVHFAKGRRAAAGAYPWMFAAYAARSGARWLNFEQDLGNPGLARSKRAYAPALIQPKLRVGLAELR